MDYYFILIHTHNQPEITIIYDIENLRVPSIASDLGAQKPSIN
jgi:hypothetical protein